MSLIEDFNSEVDKIEAAVRGALNGEIRRLLLHEILQQSQEKVYSYGATPWAMSLRRYEIGDENNMEVEVGDFYISITNVTQLQHPGGADESDVVEGGWENYRQPGPRPFMQAALDKFVSSGELDRVLQQYLSLYGVS